MYPPYFTFVKWVFNFFYEGYEKVINAKVIGQEEEGFRKSSMPFLDMPIGKQKFKTK